jgi:hypothetical protein
LCNWLDELKLCEGFEIPRTSKFFDFGFFLKIPKTDSSLILILQIPGTGGSLKNQRTA